MFVQMYIYYTETYTYNIHLYMYTLIQMNYSVSGPLAPHIKLLFHVSEYDLYRSSTLNPPTSTPHIQQYQQTKAHQTVS